MFWFSLDWFYIKTKYFTENFVNKLYQFDYKTVDYTKSNYF